MTGIPLVGACIAKTFPDCSRTPFSDSLASLHLRHLAAYEKRTMEHMSGEIETAAQEWDGYHLQMALWPSAAADLEEAFFEINREHADACHISVAFAPCHTTGTNALWNWPAKSRLPAMYAARGFVEDGGLVSYGASLPDLSRRAATYVDKILKGAKKSQPTCRSNNRPGSNWWGTSRPRKRSASTFQLRCWPAPTR